MSDYEYQKFRLIERAVIALEVLAGIRNPINENQNPKQDKDKEAWKDDPATDKQKALMVQHSIPFKEPITKGEANEKISQYIEASKKAR